MDRIMTYIKGLLGEENIQGSGAVSEAAISGIQQSADSEKAVLKIATPGMVKSTSFIGGDSNLGVFAHLSNPPLMKMDSGGKLTGQLVENYEVSENNTCWTFCLKDNLYWSDGEPVTPEDVEFSIRYYGKKTPWASWINDTLESSAVSDANNSVTFKFNKPYTRIDLEFATYNILPAHVWETIENPMEYTNNGPYTGCGPYYLKQIDLNAGKLVFEKNPYWKGKAPEFETVEVHFYSSADVATLSLKNGEVDTYYKYAGSYPYSGIEQLEGTGNFDFIEKTDIGLVFLAFNLEKAPFSDPEFREALAYAINYEEIVNLETLVTGGKSLTAVLCHLPWKTSRKPKNLSTALKKPEKLWKKQDIRIVMETGYLKEKTGKTSSLKSLSGRSMPVQANFLKNTSNMWALLQT